MAIDVIKAVMYKSDVLVKGFGKAGQGKTFPIME